MGGREPKQTGLAGRLRRRRAGEDEQDEEADTLAHEWMTQGVKGRPAGGGEWNRRRGPSWGGRCGARPVLAEWRPPGPAGKNHSLDGQFATFSDTGPPAGATNFFGECFKVSHSVPPDQRGAGNNFDFGIKVAHFGSPPMRSGE